MKHSPGALLRFYRNLSIRNKLIFILFIQIITPLIIIGYLSYKNSEGIIKENSTNYSRDILNMIRLRVSDFFNNITQISQDLLYEDKIYDVLRFSKNIIDPLKRYEYENAVNSHLKMVVISRSEIRSICIYTRDGKIFYQDDNTRKAGSQYEIPFSDMAELAREKRGKPYLYLISEDNKVKDIYLVRQINDRDTFEELGVLIMQVKKEILDEVYQGLTGNLQNIMIYTPDMELITCKNYDDLENYSDVLLDSINGGMEENINEESGLFVSYITIEETGWKILAYARLEELYRDAVTLRRNILMLCAVVIVILTFLNAFIAVDIVKPINTLVSGMKKVQAGESNVRVEVDRGDELGFLNKAFNEMSREINHLVNWVYREQLTRKEAELKALQSQINPHFLFNTLEAINWLAQLNNVPEISSTVSDLSDLMEASIGRDDRLITIREEFTYADKYISLQKRRFGDRIELIKNIHPDVVNVKIPRLLIQPLIENAVYHGIERTRGKGVITLNAERQGDVITIEVIDNGAGMEPEELKQLNQSLAMDNDTYFRNLGGKKSKSIGIENVNRRIKLFYGEKYGLVIDSKLGQYTKVVATIPAEPDVNDGEDMNVQSSDN